MILIRHLVQIGVITLPEIQKGTTSLPILVTPRIGGIPITQSEIKTNHSSVYIDDSTPLSFTLEYKSRGDIVNIIHWDESQSTEDTIFFPMPDSFYANEIVWTILPYWKILGLTKTEKVYADEAIQIEIKDLHLGL